MASGLELSLRMFPTSEIESRYLWVTRSLGTVPLSYQSGDWNVCCCCCCCSGFDQRLRETRHKRLMATLLLIDRDTRGRLCLIRVNSEYHWKRDYLRSADSSFAATKYLKNRAFVDPAPDKSSSVYTAAAVR